MRILIKRLDQKGKLNIRTGVHISTDPVLTVSWVMVNPKAKGPFEEVNQHSICFRKEGVRGRTIAWPFSELKEQLSTSDQIVPSQRCHVSKSLACAEFEEND